MEMPMCINCETYRKKFQLFEFYRSQTSKNQEVCALLLKVKTRLKKQEKVSSEKDAQLAQLSREIEDLKNKNRDDHENQIKNLQRQLSQQKLDWVALKSEKEKITNDLENEKRAHTALCQEKVCLLRDIQTAKDELENQKFVTNQFQAIVDEKNKEAEELDSKFSNQSAVLSRLQKRHRALLSEFSLVVKDIKPSPALRKIKSILTRLEAQDMALKLESELSATSPSSSCDGGNSNSSDAGIFSADEETVVPVEKNTVECDDDVGLFGCDIELDEAMDSQISVDTVIESLEKPILEKSPSLNSLEASILGTKKIEDDKLALDPEVWPLECIKAGSEFVPDLNEILKEMIQQRDIISPLSEDLSVDDVSDTKDTIDERMLSDTSDVDDDFLTCSSGTESVAGSRIVKIEKINVGTNTVSREVKSNSVNNPVSAASFAKVEKASVGTNTVSRGVKDAATNTANREKKDASTNSVDSPVSGASIIKVEKAVVGTNTLRREVENAGTNPVNSSGSSASIVRTEEAAVIGTNTSIKEMKDASTSPVNKCTVDRGTMSVSKLTVNRGTSPRRNCVKEVSVNTTCVVRHDKGTDPLPSEPENATKTSNLVPSQSPALPMDTTNQSDPNTEKKTRLSRISKKRSLGEDHFPPDSETSLPEPKKKKRGRPRKVPVPESGEDYCESLQTSLAKCFKDCGVQYELITTDENEFCRIKPCPIEKLLEENHRQLHLMTLVNTNPLSENSLRLNSRKMLNAAIKQTIKKDQQPVSGTSACDSSSEVLPLQADKQLRKRLPQIIGTPCFRRSAIQTRRSLDAFAQLATPTICDKSNLSPMKRTTANCRNIPQAMHKKRESNEAVDQSKQLNNAVDIDKVHCSSSPNKTAETSHMMSDDSENELTIVTDDEDNCINDLVNCEIERKFSSSLNLQSSDTLTPILSPAVSNCSLKEVEDERIGRAIDYSPQVGIPSQKDAMRSAKEILSSAYTKSSAEDLNDAILKLRNRDIVPMAAAASGRVAQLVTAHQTKTRKTSGSIQKGKSKLSQLRTKLAPKPLIMPKDRIQMKVGCLSPSSSIQMKDSGLPLEPSSVQEKNPQHSPPCQSLEISQVPAPALCTNDYSSSDIASAALKIEVEPEDGFVKIPKEISPFKYALNVCEAEEAAKKCQMLVGDELEKTVEVAKIALKNFTASEFTSGSLEKCVLTLGDPNLVCSSPVITREILNYEKDDFDEPVCLINRKIPQLTSTQQKFITLIIQLKSRFQHLKGLPNEVLSLIEYRMYRLGHSPEIDHAVWFVRLHTSLCRILDLRPRALTFCWDAMYAVNSKVARIVHTVLLAWPALFPQSLDLKSACPNTKTFMHFLLSRGDLDPKFNPDCYALKKLIAGRISKGPEVNSEMLAVSFMESLKGDNSDLLVPAIVLLGKREAITWSLGNLIQKHLIPKITISHDTYTSMKTRENAIHALCCILRAMNSSDAQQLIDKTLDLLKSLLFQATVSNTVTPSLQEAIVVGLSVLGRHNIEFVADAIIRWKPEHANTTGLSPRLISQIVSVIKSGVRNFKWFQARQKLI